MSQVSSGLEKNSAGHSEEVAGCHGQGNIWKMIFFQVKEKSGNFVDGKGNLFILFIYFILCRLS